MKKTLAEDNPFLLKEWNFEKNSISPTEVTPATTKKVWWTCGVCGYDYLASISNRNKNGSGCPVCSNQLLVEGINDLSTKYPEIAAEWSDLNNISPNKVIAGGHNKYFFKCSHCSNVWKAALIARIRGTGCPKCSFSLHTSIPEQVIFRCLHEKIPEVCNSFKPDWLNGKEIDIYIPSLKVGVEYDGAGWHKDTAKDIKKTNDLQKHGITLIRIREPKCINLIDSSIKIIVNNYTNIQDYLNKVVNKLFIILNEQFNMNLKLGIDVTPIYNDVLLNFRDKKLVKSFATEFPELLKEWNYEKNDGLDPYKISPRSGIKIWWKCINCGYEWCCKPDRRAIGAGCPYCSHEVVWIGHNDIKTLRPDLLEEWDNLKNIDNPETLSPNSHKKIWWKCKHCGHEWKSALYVKSNGHGCPKCARQLVANKQSKPVMNIDTGEIYKSAKDADEKTGIGHSNITRVCRGEGKKAGGYHWKYIEK